MKPYFKLVFWVVFLLLALWFTVEAWSMFPCWLEKTCALGRWIHGGYMVSSALSVVASSYNVWRMFYE